MREKITKKMIIQKPNTKKIHEINILSVGLKKSQTNFGKTGCRIGKYF